MQFLNRVIRVTEWNGPKGHESAGMLLTQVGKEVIEHPGKGEVLFPRGKLDAGGREGEDLNVDPDAVHVLKPFLDAHMLGGDSQETGPLSVSRSSTHSCRAQIHSDAGPIARTSPGIPAGRNGYANQSSSQDLLMVR